jgi:hypothetical protein
VTAFGEFHRSLATGICGRLTTLGRRVYRYQPQQLTIPTLVPQLEAEEEVVATAVTIPNTRAGSEGVTEESDRSKVKEGYVLISCRDEARSLVEVLEDSSVSRYQLTHRLVAECHLPCHDVIDGWHDDDRGRGWWRRGWSPAFRRREEWRTCLPGGRRARWRMLSRRRR